MLWFTIQPHLWQNSLYCGQTWIGVDGSTCVIKRSQMIIEQPTLWVFRKEGVQRLKQPAVTSEGDQNDSRETYLMACDPDSDRLQLIAPNIPTAMLQRLDIRVGESLEHPIGKAILRVQGNLMDQTPLLPFEPMIVDGGFSVALTADDTLTLICDGVEYPLTDRPVDLDDLEELELEVEPLTLS